MHGTSERESKPDSDAPTQAKLDEPKALELAYNFALTYSSTFNTVGAAVIFGVFGILIVIDTSEKFTATWTVLSMAYFLTVITVLYFYLRAIRYSLMAIEVAKRLGILTLAERIYAETPQANSLLPRLMAGKLQPYGPFTRIYFIIGPLLLLIIWVAVGLF